MNRDHVRAACPLPKRWKRNLPWSCPECYQVWVLRRVIGYGGDFENTWKDTGVNLNA